VLRTTAAGFLTRRRLSYYKKIISELRSAVKSREEARLTHWLGQAEELPNGGQHFPLVQEAQALLRRLEHESKVRALRETPPVSTSTSTCVGDLVWVRAAAH
jgi:hypothetical protein